MGEVTEHWPHRELVTRLLATLDTEEWRTITEMTVHDPRVFNLYTEVNLWHREEDGYVISRIREGTNEREYLLTSGGVERVKGRVSPKALV